MGSIDRRSVLKGIGGASIAGAAGCLDNPGGGGGTRQLGISQHDVGGSWVTAFFEAGELYAEEQGYDLQTQTHDEDATQQISQVRQMINQEFDGIILVPWDESLNDVIEEATDAGIPVFTANSDATTSAIKSFTAFGNYDAGVHDVPDRLDLLDQALRIEFGEHALACSPNSMRRA
jgi:ribose transport system substrate-binding protein